MKMKLTLTIAALSVATTAINAALILPNGDFESTAAQNPMATTSGWTNNQAGRTFDGSGSTGRVLISQSPNNAMIVTHTGITGMNLAANTQYTIDFVYGNASSATFTSTGTWTAELGTITGGLFTAIGAGAKTSVSFTGTGTGSEIFFASSNQKSYSGVALTTGATIANSGDQLSIRLNNGTGVIQHMGFDNIGLTAVAVPEPSAVLLGALGLLGLLRRRR